MYKLKLYSGEDVDLEKVMKKLARKWPHLRERLREALQILKENPYKGEPLIGKYKGFWKLRIGDWRIIYAINEREKEVYILSLCHRRSCY